MDKICLITFSDNADHQNVIYSMYYTLQGKAEVYTIGITSPKSLIAPHSPNNFYFDCPKRPGIEFKTFRLDIVRKIAKIIKEKKIKYFYIESLHIWNLLLMWIMVDGLGIHEMAAWAIGTVIVFVWNYLIRAKLIYRGRIKNPGEDNSE